MWHFSGTPGSVFCAVRVDVLTAHLPHLAVGNPGTVTVALWGQRGRKPASLGRPMGWSVGRPGPGGNPVGPHNTLLPWLFPSPFSVMCGALQMVPQQLVTQTCIRSDPWDLLLLTTGMPMSLFPVLSVLSW